MLKILVLVLLSVALIAFAAYTNKVKKWRHMDKDKLPPGSEDVAGDPSRSH